MSEKQVSGVHAHHRRTTRQEIALFMLFRVMRVESFIRSRFTSGLILNLNFKLRVEDEAPRAEHGVRVELLLDALH